MKNIKLIKTGEPAKDFLRDLFIAGEISMPKLANKSGLDRSLPYSWLSGKSKPSLSAWIRLCKVVGQKTQHMLDESSQNFKTMRWWLDRALEITKWEGDLEHLEKVIDELDLEIAKPYSSSNSQPENQFLTEILNKLGVGIPEALAALQNNPRAGKHITVTQIVINLE